MPHPRLSVARLQRTPLESAAYGVRPRRMQPTAHVEVADAAATGKAAEKVQCFLLLTKRNAGPRREYIYICIYSLVLLLHISTRAR
jgi:hypothetical protein